MTATRPSTYTEPTLIIGDYSSKCGVCGQGADPGERSHRTVLPGWSGLAGEAYGCGVTWTHVAGAADGRTGAEERIREMRPDLTWRGELL